MLHKDTRIEFTIENRRYEAVGFLDFEEERVEFLTMWERTKAKNGGAIEKEDVFFIKGKTDQFPKELQAYYFLVTNLRPLKTHEKVNCFINFMNRGEDSCWWPLETYSLEGTPDGWGKEALVLRRLS